MKVKILYLMLASFCCHADIYQCLKHNNPIEFRDKPCEANSVEKMIDTLEIGTNVNLVGQHKLSEAPKHHSHEQQKAEKKKVIAERKKILIAHKAEKKALRLKKREEKLALQEAHKKDKQIKKQKKIADKLQKIENQLRLGTKLKNRTTLHAQLEKERKKLQSGKDIQHEDKTYHSEKTCQNPL